MGGTTYRNSPELGWVVQKFGGTSVGKFAGKVSRIECARGDGGLFANSDPDCE